MTTLTRTTTFFGTLRATLARWHEPGPGLRDLDARALADIGVDRSEISSIEWEARGCSESTRLRVVQGMRHA